MRHDLFFRIAVLDRLMHQIVVSQRKQRPLSPEKRTAVITILCKIIYTHNQNLNAYQKLYGLTLRTSGATKRSIGKLSFLYDTVSYTTLTKILDTFAAESKKMMKSWEKETVIHCGDNLDFRTAKRHEGGGSSFHEAHLYNNMLYKSRINVNDMSNTPPPAVEIETVDYGQFLLDASEEQQLLQHMMYHIKASWNSLVSTSVVSEKPCHKYEASARKKTEKVFNRLLGSLIKRHFFLFLNVYVGDAYCRPLLYSKCFTLSLESE